MGLDEHAFDTMYNEHVPGLIRFARSYVGSLAEAEDIVADVFVRLWEKRTEWSPQHGTRTYLYTAVRNRALNTLRDSRADTELDEVTGHEDDSQNTDQALEHKERSAQLKALIQSFKPARRRLIILRWQQGLSVAEIAQVLQISHNAVEQQLSRALKAIRDVAPEALK